MNRIRKYARKRDHVNYVRDYVCSLHNEIFQLALVCDVSAHKAVLYKKWSRYLRILEL